MEHERGFEAFDCYRLVFGDWKDKVLNNWSPSAKQTLPLKPNRSYVISVLLNADFEHPAEINLGLKSVDHAGRQVIWNFNGPPNRTDGRQRWEWEFSTDPRAMHGMFSILLMDLPVKGSQLRLADVASIQLPEKGGRAGLLRETRPSPASGTDLKVTQIAVSGDLIARMRQDPKPVRSPAARRLHRSRNPSSHIAGAYARNSKNQPKTPDPCLSATPLTCAGISLCCIIAT